MPDKASKLKLSENHRRVVSVLLRGVEQMCDSIAAWRERLRALVEEVRAELRRVASDIELQRSSESPRRAIRALVSAMSVELEERQSPRLAGYGPLSDAAKEKIDAEIGRLLALLGRMTEVLR